MADAPWKNKLTKGLVIQRLEALGCKEVEQVTDSSRLWVAPTGQPFSISYESDVCDAEYLEGIVAQLERWADDSRKKR